MKCIIFLIRFNIKSTLDNLIINAIQYSKEGNITLELHKNSDSTAIDFSIQDEGIAIL